MPKLDAKEYSLDLLELLGNEIRYKKEYVRNDIYRLYLKKTDIELLEKYLTELEQIKNSNPSEVMECLESFKNEYVSDCQGKATSMLVWYDKQFTTIKNYILKAQENEMILEVVIKEKNLFEPTHKYVVEYSKSYDNYCKLFKAYKLDELNKLSEKEFNSVKEYLK